MHLEKKFNLYNDTQTVIGTALKSIKDIFTLNFGSVLKGWLVDKKLNTLTVEKKNFLLTQEMRRIIISQKYQDINITSNDLKRLIGHLDEFLEKKLEEKVGKSIIELFINAKLKLEESTKFNEFTQAASYLLEENKEKKKEIIKSAKVLESISYPLTEKYFLCRYLAKAIICKSKEIEENGPLLEEPKSYKDAKNLCLSFLKEISTHEGLKEQSNKIVQEAEKQFISEHKYTNVLLKVSNAVNIHSSKIAAVYIAYVAAITGIRYGFEDEKDKWWYEYIAAPSTILAMLQIFSSFPQILFSGTKARKIDNYISENLQTIDLQFIEKNIPTFSHDILSKAASGSRWLGNMMLQPIDLIQNDTKDLILGLTSLRWFTPAGIIEEQSKVAHFAKCELRNFFYEKIVAVLADGNKELDNQYIKRFFYLLHEQMEEDKREKLKEVYEKLTEKQDVNLRKIVSVEEKKQISSYKWWIKVTYIAATTALALDYACFAARKYVTQDYFNWYEDPVFYIHAAVKFMRFGSLTLSSKYASEIVKYFTGNELTDNTYFNDFFYNNAARMVLAIAPLIVFESTSDVKILSIATAVDVLTTVRSDIKCGDAISMTNDFSTRKATNEKLRLRDLQNSELQDVVVESQNVSLQPS